MPDQTQRFTWEQFAADVAEIAEVDRSCITPTTRLIGDLDLESLGFVELATLVLVDYQVDTLPNALQGDGLGRLTVGELFAYVRESDPPRWKVRSERDEPGLASM